MKLKGIEVKRAKHLGYRDSDPKRDVDLDGDPVDSCRIAIVRQKDCLTYWKDGRKYYNPDNAKAIPINHGSSWYGYGKERKRKVTHMWYNGIWVWDVRKREDVYIKDGTYYTVPFYAVKDGVVYTGTIRHKYSPNAEKELSAKTFKLTQEIPDDRVKHAINILTMRLERMERESEKEQNGVEGEKEVGIEA